MSQPSVSRQVQALEEELGFEIFVRQNKRFLGLTKPGAEVLKIAGRIFPSTAANVALEAVLEDGKILRGESRISRSRRRIREIRLLPPRARPLPEALEAIERADERSARDRCA